MSTRLDGPARTRRDTGRVLTVAGGAYVLAWLTGLVAAPARPAATDEAALGGFMREHMSPLLVQSLLVHGVAGVALLVVAVGAGRRLGSTASTISGAAAAALSVTQVALLVAAAVSADRSADGSAARLLDAVDAVDGAKLLALAGFVVASSAAGGRSGLLPRWSQVLGALLAGSLVLGAASFLPGLDGPLGAVLFAALPLLLVYVATVAVLVSRGRPLAGDPEASW